jgi:tetraprenyl-beta-curcumene synthase
MRGAVKQAGCISAAQATALVTSAGRELCWGLSAVLREVGAWQAIAATIPDTIIRSDALGAIDRKRSNIDGAGMFSTLPLLRRWLLLRLLVTYEVMCDFLDSVSERGAAAGLDNGRQLHLAFTEALDPVEPISDYYRYHPWREDGGYLLLLVRLCRAICELLPSYRAVKPVLLRAAGRAGVQALNHEPDPDLRIAALRCWVDSEFGKWLGLVWYEMAGSASAWISVLALLALAAEPRRDRQEASDTYSAYFWVCLAATMLDSYVDETEDANRGDHSYFGYYPNVEEGVERVAEIVARAAREVGSLRDGRRHMVIVACMVALYLSKDTALRPGVVQARRSLLHAGGPLTVLLGPVLRIWRAACGVREC